MQLIQVARNRQKLGEFTEAEIIEGLQSGRFLPTDIAWAPPMTEWVPLSDYKFGTPASFSTPAVPAGGVETSSYPATTSTGAGIPWDQTGSGRYLSDWWQTTINTLLSPIQTFRSAQLTGGYAKPLAFVAIGSTLGGIVSILLQSLVSLTTVAQSEAGASALLGVPAGILCGIVLIPICAVIGSFIGGGILHLFLMMFGGAKEGFETTMRAYCYPAGATQTLGVIPGLGSLVALIWFPVVLAIALKEMHKTEYWKVILAILIPLVLCCGLIIAIAGMAIAGVAQMPQ